MLIAEGNPVLYLSYLATLVKASSSGAVAVLCRWMSCMGPMSLSIVAELELVVSCAVLCCAVLRTRVASAIARESGAEWLGVQGTFAPVESSAHLFPPTSTYNSGNV